LTSFAAIGDSAVNKSSQNWDFTAQPPCCQNSNKKILTAADYQSIITLVGLFGFKIILNNFYLKAYILGGNL
jgi:hypothetical protein